MKKTKSWHETDKFWETVEPILFGEQRWLNAPVQVDQLIALLKIEPGAKVLDLCCGVGRHSLELARRGFQITTVDRTTKYLNQAEATAKKEKLHIEFIQEDMRKFCRVNSFDAVINVFTSFGYFENQIDDKKVVKNVYRSLNPGGIFLLELMGKEILARIFLDRNRHEENGIIVLEERKLSQNWGWIENRWIILKNGKKYELNLAHRVYSAVELIGLLKECGFKKVEAYGDLAGSPYDQHAKRLVVKAYK